jgi:hypothetical protein
MSTIVITGWKVGFLKISHTEVLREAASMSLSEAKAVTDSVLDGKTVTIPVATEAQAEDLAARLCELKAVAHVAGSAELKRETT